MKNHWVAVGCATLIASTSVAQTASPLGKLPLFFEANQGQAENSAAFLARTADAQCAITASGMTMNLRSVAGKSSQLNMSFVGANSSAQIHGDAELAGKVNYLIGNNPAQWHAGVPTFAKVRVEQIYPGVDVVFYGNQQQLEYDFNFAAGANPAAVALRFSGADNLQLAANGDLLIALGDAEIRQPQPTIYQIINGAHQPVSGGYKILNGQTVAFNVGNYDHTLPLVIDPVLSYSTYFGGNAGETAQAVAVDQAGFVYVAGKTFSSTFTNKISWSTTNAIQTNYHGGSAIGDAFVAKFDNAGSNLVYMTYLGGKSDDVALAVAADAQGNAYVAGYTSSADFPTTHLLPTSGLKTNISGKLDPHLGIYPIDGFVAELNTNGSRLVYSGFLGGSEADGIIGLAVDPSSGVAYVTGSTYSTNFPTTSNALSRKLACPYSQYYNANAFVAVIAAGATNFNYSTYLGGTNFDAGRAIAFNNGYVLVAGRTVSTNFPKANFIPGYKFLNGATNYINLNNDVFVTAFTVSSPTNLTLLYSTLLGGSASDIANGIAADAAGNAYVVGSTTSTNFPYTNVLASFGTNWPSSVLTNRTGLILATNAFLTQIKWNNATTNAYIGYSAVFGGVGIDVASAVALDADTGNAYITGYASSTNFPVTSANRLTTNGVSICTTNSGGSDAFLTVFSADGSTLITSTYLGGRADDFAYGIAVDMFGDAYVVGQTLSTNFPALNARQKFRNGTNDSFLAKISLGGAPALALVPQNNSVHGKAIGGGKAASQPTLQLAWRMFPGTYTLECTTNVFGSNTWVKTTGPANYSNGWFNLNVPATNPSQFFRLHKN